MIDLNLFISICQSVYYIPFIYIRLSIYVSQSKSVSTNVFIHL